MGLPNGHKVFVFSISGLSSNLELPTEVDANSGFCDLTITAPPHLASKNHLKMCRLIALLDPRVLLTML
jgi:hypothetical protein